MLQQRKELIWLRSFIGEFTDIFKGPTTLRCDNNSAIELTKDSKFHARTKHIDIRYHFIREAVENGTITLKYVPSKENLADVFTKALPRNEFEHFVKKLGLHLV